MIGFSTGYGEYIVMEPSECYSSFVEAVQEKIYMSKIVIEFLVHSYESSYEDLLNKLQVIVPPPGVVLTEDTLLRHAQFVCDQVSFFNF